MSLDVSSAKPTIVRASDKEGTDMFTILLIVVVVLLLTGGGGYYARRGRRS